MNLMVEQVTRDKNETMIIVSVIVKNNIAHAKKIIPRILVHLHASVTRIVKLLSIWNVKSLIDDIVVTCDKMVVHGVEIVVTNPSNGKYY